MFRSLHKFLFLVTIFFLTQPFYSRQPNDHAGNRIRLHVGPVIGLYKINANVASGLSQQFSALIGLNKEFKLGRDYKTFLTAGLDYMHFGLNFDSYYFPPGTLQIYDKNFDHRYNLSINELSLPLRFKYLFKPENNSLFSPYLAVGYHLRYFMPGKIAVTQEGTPVKDEVLDLKFKTPIGADNINAAISLSAGWQKNNLSNSHGSFFVEINYRYNFSPYYFKTDYSASSLYMNGSQFSLLLGIKF